MKHVRAARSAVLGISLAVLFSGAASAEMVVARSLFAREVIGREPDGVAQSFSPDVGKIIFFNQLTGITAPTFIKHVWIYDNKVELEVKLPVEEEGWRVWSVKTLSPQQTGLWHVEVLDADGNVLESATINIGG